MYYLSDGLEVEEVEEPKEEKKPKTEQKEKWEYKVMNKDTAIWARNKEDITTEEYENFYVALTKEAYSHPASWIHFKAEGEVEFRSIIYIPTEPHDLYEHYQDRKPQVKLYVRKVLIQSDFEDLLPKYLNFIKGIDYNYFLFIYLYVLYIINVYNIIIYISYI